MTFRYAAIPRREIIRMAPTAEARAKMAESYRRMRTKSPTLARLVMRRIRRAEKEFQKLILG